MSKKKEDELSFVKAAAWAWYQRSAYEGEPFLEFALTRTRPAHKPSRYKLEAMRNTISDKLPESPPSPTSETTSLALSPAHTDMSLLDSYEIERIARQLDCILEAQHRSEYADDGQLPVKNMSPLVGEVNKKKMAGKLNGFWLRHAIGICSARGSVMEPMVLGQPRRRRHSTIEKLNNSRR